MRRSSILGAILAAGMSFFVAPAMAEAPALVPVDAGGTSNAAASLANDSEHRT
ncbi:MAG: hypothetical protein K2X31_03265 [Sphingopyxis sp.]|nr:hypothetical protein [Sphingopyxis sp.]